jgi:hypothetical protein
VREGVDDLAECRADTRRVDERGHQVHVGLGGLGPNPGERRCDRGGIALALGLLQAAPLFLFHLGTDAQDRRRRLVAALEESGDADTTQLKPGSVRIVCGHGADRSIEVPLSGQVSYYNPSGNQLVPAKGGFDALGPQLHLIPANPNTLPISDSQGHPLQLVKALPTNTTCGLAFDMSVVDKANLQVCAVPGGRPASCVGRLADCPQFQQGCMPGDVSAFSFGVDGMTLSASVVDGQQNVSLTQPIFVTSNVPFDQNNIQNITLSPAPSGLAISLGTPNVSQIQVSFGMAGLAPLTMYTLTVPTTVTDSFEQPPPAPLVIHFTTAAM